MREDFIIPVSQLKWRCDASMLTFETTADIAPSKELIGQERAMKALNFGLSVKRKGYNIFVSGITGTGRNSYAYSIAKAFAEKRRTPDDWCYVYNFKKPEHPNLIRFKSGEGGSFKKEVENLIAKLKIDMPKAFSSKEYENKKSTIFNQYEKKIEEITDELNEVAIEHSFIYKQTDGGLVSIPLIDGRPMTDEEINLLSDEIISDLKNKLNRLNTVAFDIFNKIKGLEEQLRNRIKQLNEKVAFDVVEVYMNPIMEQFKGDKNVEAFLNEMEDDMIKNIDEFLEKDKSDKFKEILSKAKGKKNFFKRYQVNHFIDNGSKEGAPVIREANPNYYNLLGKIEYVNELGVLQTDHTRIKPGAIHEANGGYLIIQAKDILKSSYAWEGLKRAINTEVAKIENISRGDSYIVAETIKPEAMPIDVKVIMIGDYFTYQILYNYDEDFKKLFRIRADFDIEMDKSQDNISKLASFIGKHCKDEGLRSFDKSAVCKIIEYGSKLAEDQKKLTSRFNELVEVLYEADTWAESLQDDIVTEEHVKRAIKEKNYRNNKYEEKLQELFKDEIILIDTSGYQIGQINGLAVMDSGQYSFGRPNKITISTFLGKDGIVNIEREVEQSGNSYDKGFLILSGYLGSKYAKKKPLSLSASITFEQSYDLIDGDSASSTELYGLLSSLSEVPINQAIAVTGSINQKGFIQPIGGVNEKIEGYFKVCKAKGFKGREGVMIPYQNINNLMLDDEVIEAVKEGIFTIYAVKTIEEGIEILTGIPAGNEDSNGNYPMGSINYLVQRKLDRYANISKEFE